MKSIHSSLSLNLFLTEARHSPAAENFSLKRFHPKLNVMNANLKMIYRGRGSCRWEGFGGHARPGCPVVLPVPALSGSLSAVLSSGRWQGDCPAHRRWTWNLTSRSWLPNSASAFPPSPGSALPLTYTNENYGNVDHTCRTTPAFVVPVHVFWEIGDLK